MPFRSPHPDVVIPHVTLSELVLTGAGAYPERPALVDGLTGRSLSFGELCDQVRCVATGLSRWKWLRQNSKRCFSNIR